MECWGMLIILLASITCSQVSGTPCGTVINSSTESFVITNPNASAYTDQCYITLPTQKTPLAMYFNTEQMILTGNDSLTVYNGVPGTKGASAIIRFNQTVLDPSNTPMTFYSSGTMNITLVWSSSKVSKSAFMLNVTPGNCNYTFKTVSSVVVSSPVYQVESANASEIQCVYTLKYDIEGTKEMVLAFDKVNLANGTINVSNKTVFKDGTTSIPDQLIDDNTVTLWFNLSTGKENNGFTAVASGLSPECTQTVVVNTSLSELTSLNYPGDYGNNLQCRWIISSPPGTKIWFFVEDFMMGDNVDHLMLRDGNSHVSNVIGDFSHMNQPVDSLLTSGNSAWMQFETDESMVSKGFRIVMRAILHGGMYRDSGTIVMEKLNTTVPIDTKDIDNEIYIHLLTDPDKQILAEVSVPKGVMLPSSSIMCYEGLVSDPQKLIADFTTHTPFYPIFTEGFEMLIVVDGFLHNNTFRPNLRLDINFTSRVQDNTLQYSVGELGSYSLTKQQVYTTAAGATWLIHPQMGEMTSLTFSTLEVLQEYEVNVYNGQAVIPAKVGHFTASQSSVPTMYLSKGARVDYKMVSGVQQILTNGTDDVPVLEASFQNIPVCSESFDSRSGVITSPMFPDRYPYNAQCMWTIAIPVNKSIHLFFTDYKLALDHSVTITVINVISTNKTQNITKRVIAELNSKSTPGDFITNGSEIQVEFSSMSASGYEVSTGFRMEFEIMDCGANLSVSGKSISTPGFPAVTKGNITCVWIISLPPPAKHGDNNSVNFSYEIKNVMANTTAKLEIKDGGTSQSESFDVPLKNGKVGSRLSLYNQLYVAYRQNVAVADINKTTGFAFQLDFKSYECNASMQCGNGICLHPDWRCNGLDDCGDMTDERNCTAKPPATPATHTGVRPWAVALAVILTFVAAVLLTIFVPRFYHRCRNRNYGTLHEDLTPVET